MADIVILILFTYPGVISEYIYNRLAAKKSFLAKPDEIFRVARDFCVSVLVTVCALSVFNLRYRLSLSVSGLADELMKGSRMINYGVISFALSVVAGFVWFAVMWLCFRLKNCVKKKNTGTTASVRRQVWEDFKYMKGVPLDGCVLAIYKDRELVRAGILKEITDDPSDDPGILLYDTGTVEHEMSKPRVEWKHLDGAYISYYDMNTGTTYSIHDGKRMMEYIDSRRAGQS